MKGRASLAHAGEVRERILGGAERTFAAAGYRGASVPAIAREAGVSVGLIYRYFPSKEELFLAVVQTRTDARLDEIAATLAAIPDPATRLVAAVDQFVDSLEEERWGSIILHAAAEADRNPQLREMLAHLFEQLRSFAALFLREAVARGEARPGVDVEALSRGAAMLLHGAILHQAGRGPRFDRAATSRAIVATLSAALARAV